MTSSILPPRSALAPCSPSTQAMASTTLLLPDPLGPTTAVTPGSKRSVVAEAKDLKPRSVRDLRCTSLPVVDPAGAARRRVLAAQQPTARPIRYACSSAECGTPSGQDGSTDLGDLMQLQVQLGMAAFPQRVQLCLELGDALAQPADLQQ